MGNRIKGAQLTDAGLKSVLNSFYKNGDYQFTSPSHHGTPEERMSAVLAGYSQSSLKFNEVYAASVKFIGVDKANEPLTSSLSFSLTDFESILATVLSKRATGFAELRGNLSPGMTAAWDAKILLPGATECTVTWKNEYQGDYGCTMVETLDVDIATNEWTKLANELRDEGWKGTFNPSPTKLVLKEIVFESSGEELILELDDKNLSRLGYMVDISIPFDNY